MVIVTGWRYLTIPSVSDFPIKGKTRNSRICKSQQTAVKSSNMNQWTW